MSSFHGGRLLVCAENIAWKRPVEGIREMCDSCYTTLFNVHWTCTKCGHAVCLDCFNALRSCTHPADADRCRPCEQIYQRCCVRRRLHTMNDLMPTQIIPTDGESPPFFFALCDFHLFLRRVPTPVSRNRSAGPGLKVTPRPIFGCDEVAPRANLVGD